MLKVLYHGISTVHCTVGLEEGLNKLVPIVAYIWNQWKFSNLCSFTMCRWWLLHLDTVRQNTLWYAFANNNPKKRIVNQVCGGRHQFRSVWYVLTHWPNRSSVHAWHWMHRRKCKLISDVDEACSSEMILNSPAIQTPMSCWTLPRHCQINKRAMALYISG